MPKLRHVDQHGRCGQPADPRYCHQAADAVFEGSALSGDLLNHFVQCLNVGGNIIDAAAELLSNNRVQRRRQACFRRDLIFDQGATRSQQLSEIMDIFALHALRGKVEAHFSQIE